MIPAIQRSQFIREFWASRAVEHTHRACHYLDFWRDAFSNLWRLFALERAEWKAPMLDLGCGVGVFAYLWPDAIVLDVSEELLKIHPGRYRVCADAAHLPFCSGSFETVGAITVLQFLFNPLGAIAEIRRILRRGGVLLALDDFSKSERPWHRTSYKNWHPRQWWDKQLCDFHIAKIPVTGIDQKLFAFFGGGLITFTLSMIIDPIWKKVSARYELWVCRRG